MQGTGYSAFSGSMTNFVLRDRPKVTFTSGFQNDGSVTSTHSALRRLRLHRIAEIRQQIGHAQRGRAGLGGSDQCDLGLVDRRKTVLRRQDPMARQDRDSGQNAQAEAGGDRGLDAGRLGLV